MEALLQPHPDPPWSRPPQHEWVLTEIKDGVEVATHRLDCRSVVLGRAADQVHITLAHPSISRHHARIAFDGQGTPWLRDLQSSHGVTINKKAYPKVAIGRNESDSAKPGARGVVLYPGDVLQFGASTRIFCLEGPEEFARGAIRPVTEKIRDASVNTNSTSEGTISATSATQDVASVSRQEDESEREDSDWRQTRPFTDETVPEQYQKEWEKIKALQFKLANVTTESERIRVKEDLSTGQERQLERNDERIQQLTEQIHQKENELYRKVYPDTTNQYLAHHRHDRSKDQRDDDDIEDDFFDRTKTATESTLLFNKDGESELSLIAKWNALSEQREELLKDIKTCQLKVSALQQKMGRISAESPDDLFFAQNEYELANESYLKLQTKAEGIHGHLLEIQQLIALANPKLRLVNGQWATTTTAIATDAYSAPLLVAVDSTSAEAQAATCPIDHSTNSTPKNDLIPSPVLPATPFSHDRDSLPLPHREKRQRLDRLSTMPPPLPLPHRAKHQPANTASPTLTAVSFLHPGSATVQPVSAEAHSTVSTNTPRLSGLSGKDDMVDAWQAPKDQDGSGRTRLNDKFAGRY
jgi:pSer/pThr/pTyr-binding forkhead associated (FHA) protein/predicted  nucleic acid-binding Zn-ribbon protein